jgi:hypothetical protein
MGSRRSAPVGLAVVAVGLVAALPAQSKEGVKATLASRVPLHARAGTPLRLVWTLGYRDEHGHSRPFAASGVFVRLLSATGASRQTAFAHRATGRYVATVLVPRGGVGGIQVGIRGWSDGPNGRHRADVLFPITNNPFRRASARTIAP